MIDFEKELEEILSSDPLGLLAVKPKTSGKLSTDDRLIASFKEITDFVKAKNREPEASKDIGERKLYSRLKGLRENPEKVTALVKYDELNLFEGFSGVREEPEVYTTQDILDRDPLGLLDEEPTENILQLRHVPKKIGKPDHIAKRKKCKDFEKFEPIFKKTHADLKVKKKVLAEFNSQSQITEGAVFLLKGMLTYVGKIGKWEPKNFGNKNARLYVVFENGTESNMYIGSLAAALWKENTNRQVVDADQKELFPLAEDGVSGDDKATGRIYVLKSLSEKPEIRDIGDLYKIGFSTQLSEERIQNAANDPTFLMAGVKLVAEFETYNIDVQKFESLLHRFFAEACLEVDVLDNNGARHTPREWFVVPLQVIKIAIKLMINGEIVDFRYDPKTREIKAR
jgi:hypothetical protein